MKKLMESLGMNNVYYVPSFKRITKLPQKALHPNDKIRFLFFSRITPYKGCDLIFEAVDILISKGYENNFEVGFYGMMQESYRSEFERKVGRLKGIATYHGVLDGTDVRSHEELATYDVFLFPTFGSDEGFPGAIVDAFIAGLPVIASDWNCNNEFIRNGENGFLIPPRNVNALAEKMEWFINHPEFVRQKAVDIQQEALRFAADDVVGKDFLLKMGMLQADEPS